MIVRSSACTIYGNIRPAVSLHLYDFAARRSSWQSVQGEAQLISASVFLALDLVSIPRFGSVSSGIGSDERSSRMLLCLQETKGALEPRGAGAAGSSLVAFHFLYKYIAILGWNEQYQLLYRRIEGQWRSGINRENRKVGSLDDKLKRYIVQRFFQYL